LIKSRKIEWLKTALIVLLTASALLLGWQTRIFNDIVTIIPFFGSVAELMWGSASTDESVSPQIREAARPISIVITGADGARFGVKHDTETRNAVYDRISSIVGEALGSASAPTEISEEEWRDALSGLGVYFEYMTAVRLSILNGWLGVRMPDSMPDMTIRRVAVAIGEDRSKIYFQNNESGKFFGADTSSAAGKAQELEIYSSNDVIFAFESGTAGSEYAPYLLIMHERTHPDVRAAAAGSTDEIMDITLRALGHGNETYMSFPEADGAITRVGTQFRIWADVNGRVIYRSSENLSQEDEQRVYSVGELIERARIIVADTIGSTSGNSEVFFESIEYGAGGSVSVYFTYYIAGGRVFLFEDGYAARVTLVSGMVMETELIFRNFTFTGDFTSLLPEIQSLAAAGGEFMLYYSDTGAERLHPSWVQK